MAVLDDWCGTAPRMELQYLYPPVTPEVTGISAWLAIVVPLCLFWAGQKPSGCPIHRSFIAMSGNVFPLPASSCCCSCHCLFSSTNVISTEGGALCRRSGEIPVFRLCRCYCSCPCLPEPEPEPAPTGSSRYPAPASPAHSATAPRECLRPPATSAHARTQTPGGSPSAPSSESRTPPPAYRQTETAPNLPPQSRPSPPAHPY